MILSAATLILLGIAITAIPQLRSTAEASAAIFSNQSAYAHMVPDNAQPAAAVLKAEEPLTSSVIRCGIAGLLALVLALATVFRKRLGAIAGLGRELEVGNSLLRQVHSGHPGGYVAWLSFGTAVLGGTLAWLLR